MKHKLFVLLGGFFLTAGLLMAAGCFTMPTSPSVVAHGGGTGGGGAIPGGGGGLIPTPTPTIGGGGGTGSISGTLSNSSGFFLTVTATERTTSAFYLTTRNGDGAYTIVGVPDGSYDVDASDPFGLQGASYPAPVDVVGGAAVTGIDISF